MNRYYYPCTKSDWQEKVLLKRKLENGRKCKPDKINKIDQLMDGILSHVNIINNLGFEQYQTLHNGNLEKIDFKLQVSKEDEFERDRVYKLPFGFKYTDNKLLDTQWTDSADDCPRMHTDEEFINLMKIYAKFIFAHKILDTNIDNIRSQIQMFYPEFYKASCNHIDIFKKDYDKYDDIQEQIFYLYKFEDGKVYLDYTSNAPLENIEIDDKFIHEDEDEDKLGEYFANKIPYEGPTVLRTVVLSNFDPKIWEIIKDIKREYNITDDQLLNDRERQPKYFQD